MKKHYFIDYENVREHGLSGLDRLDGDCHVHLMFTNNANKISLDALINSRGARLEIMKTPAGKQSLDMQLVSYLGYILGSDSGESLCYIVSKDKGYVNTARFWNSIPGVEGRVKLCGKISDSLPVLGAEPEKENAPEPETGTENSEQEAAYAAEAAQPAAEKPVKPAFSESVQEAPARSGRKTRRGGRKNRKEQDSASVQPAPAADSIPETAAEQEPVPVQEEAPVEPAAEIPEPDDREEQPEQPSAAAEPAQETKQTQAEDNIRTELNNKIFKVLSETGMDNKLVGQITSLCLKNSGRENHRQAIYRGIISKLGQKKGLEVYRVIKGII